MDFTEDRYPALTKLFQTVGAEPRVKGYLINIVKPL